MSHYAEWRRERPDAEQPLLDDPSISPIGDQPIPEDTDYDAWFDARIEETRP